MAIEIERKFRLTSDAWRAEVHHHDHLAQGYLVGQGAIEAGQARCAVRIRLADTAAFLTIKSANPGLSRAEFEYPIPTDDARQMLDTLAGAVVEKIRHHVTVDGVLFEVDEFLGANAGLIVAEVELPSEDATFPRPAWLGQEISDEPRFYNVQLASRPYTQWSQAERA